MRSASSRAIASPSPAPCACSLEVKNGSKMCGMFWWLIPRPRSETSRRTCPLLRAAETRTPVPGGVWRSALSSRIRSTWATRSGSHSSSICSGRRSSVTSDWWCAAAGVNSAATSRASWPTSVGSGRSSSAPDSSRERSSSSTASWCIRSTWPRICSRNARRVSSSRSSSASSSRKPPSEKIGVRSSCEALAMNCLRARSSRASCVLHVVERGRQPPELVVGVGPDRLREVAGGDLARRALEPLHARAQRPRDEVAGEDRDHERDAAGDQHLAADQLDVVLHVGQRVDEHRDVRAARRSRRRSPRRRSPGARWRC